MPLTPTPTGDATPTPPHGGNPARQRLQVRIPGVRVRVKIFTAAGTMFWTCLSIVVAVKSTVALRASLYQGT